ncbi:hypothetical protein ZWY2020_015177, partial [Hordeum vulgare]
KYPTPIRARVLLEALLLLLICQIINGIDKDKINLHGLCVIDKPVLGDYCCKVTHECYIDLPACLQECNKPARMVARQILLPTDSDKWNLIG